MEDIQKMANSLFKEIHEYNNEKLKDLIVGKRICRRINLTMAYECENKAAMLIANLLEKKNYYYIVDAYILYSQGEKKKILCRPDIIIVNKKNNCNEIVGIIEIKSQMGYCGVIEKKMTDEYQNSINIITKKAVYIKHCNDNYDDNYQNFWNDLKENCVEVDNNCEYIKFVGNKPPVYIVNFFSYGHFRIVKSTIDYFDKNIDENNKGPIRFYSLFNEKLQYSSEAKKEDVAFENGKCMKITDVSRKNHGFERFVCDILEL